MKLKFLVNCECILSFSFFRLIYYGIPKYTVDFIHSFNKYKNEKIILSCEC